MKGKNRSTEHVARESASTLDDRVASLRECFPEAVVEGKVQFDKLRAALADITDDRAERYSFTWAGKRDAIRLLQMPTRATLIPVPEESVNFDTTQNLFIEGDNLEVQKLIYKAYAGRVKVIVIDPPYNTGNDFIYPDNFADPLDTYLKLTGQKDSEGNPLTDKPERSGRFHSAWLSMIYPRLVMARQLLTEDGAIFISIDDGEVANLRLAMNEVFGEENFVAAFVWAGGRKNDSKQVSTTHEYILCFARSLATINAKQIEWRERKTGIESIYAAYARFTKEFRGDWGKVSSALQEWYKGLKPYDPAKEHEHYRWADKRGVYFASDISGPDDGRKSRPRYEVAHPKTNKPVPVPARGWRWEWSRMKRELADDRVHFGQDETSIPNIKVYLHENEYQAPNSVFYKDRRAASAVLRDLLQAKVFDFPKDHEIIARLVGLLAKDTDLVLDFFAGSGTTAHAVMELNKADHGARRFILVQIPEPTPHDSYAFNAGYGTIAAIARARLCAVCKQMTEPTSPQLELHQPSPPDFGFKVFKLATSHYRRWTGVDGIDPEKYAETMELFTDPLLPGWKPENVLYEVILKEGFSLASRIEKDLLPRSAPVSKGTRKPAGKRPTNTVYRVTDEEKGQTLRICMDDTLHPDAVKALELKDEELFICRDIALTDELAANLALQCRLKTI